MTKSFSISKLEELITPYSLKDVLDSLQANGLVEEYTFEYRIDTVEIVIPKHVEIKEVMTGFQVIVESGRKGGIH